MRVTWRVRLCVRKQRPASARQSGFLLTIFLLLLSGMLLLTMSGLTRATTELRATSGVVSNTQAFHIAEAGLDSAVRQIIHDLNLAGGTFPSSLSVTSPAFTGYQFSPPIQVTYLDTGATQRTMPSGAFQGMQASTRQAKITVDVSSTAGIGRAHLEQAIEMNLVPAFQFGFFTDGNEAFIAGPALTMDGPIHINGRLRLGSDSTLTLLSTKVTATGDILHYGTMAGDVLIRYTKAGDPRDGNTYNMKNADGTWLQSTDANWATESVNRWGQTVEVHTPSIQMPLVADNLTSIQVIKNCNASDTPELKAAKLCYQADLRIIDGNCYDRNGNPLFPSINPVSTTSFYDARAGVTMPVYDIDVAKLRTSGVSPANGLLYVGTTTANGVRLINSSQLPTGGLSVVTHRPLYVKGDYNTVSKQPASLMSDSLTILSNNWKDANSTKDTYQRIASNTTVNAGVMPGKTSMMFLEDWTSKTFTYLGSHLALWVPEESSMNDGCCGNFPYSYNPPIRVWNFDASFLTSQPPKSPSFYSTVSLVWLQPPQ